MATPSTPRRRIRTLLLSALFAAVLATGLIPLAPGLAAKPALAAQTEHLDVGGAIDYGGHSTHWMWVDGMPAFCADSSRVNPISWDYDRKDLLWGASSTNVETRSLVRAVLYYGWGGPAFDPTLWPSTWYDGSAMSDEDYVVAEHILLSDLYTGDFDRATHGCSEKFKTYVRNNITGFLDSGPVSSYEKTARAKIAKLAQAVPSEFTAFLLVPGQGTQNIFSFDKFEPNGTVRVEKSSSLAAVTDGNALYRLGGAVYGVYRDKACTDEICTMTTADDGTAETDGIPAGTYYVRERSAPAGFLLDETVHEVVVPSGGTGTVKSIEEPLVGGQGAAVLKTDAETGDNAPQGDASLSGAEFTFSYYAGFYDSAANARASGEPERSWTLRTNAAGATGIALADDTFSADGEELPYFVSGDELYRNADGEPVVPLGTLVVKETKAPDGYLMADDAEFLLRYEQDGSDVRCIGTVRSVSGELVPDGLAGSCVEQVARGGVSIEKRDAESSLQQGLGSASLDGTTFEVVNRSRAAVTVGGIAYNPGDVCLVIESQDGRAQSAEDALPYGTYGIREVSAGEGYLVSDGEERPFSIVEDGQHVSFEGDSSAFDQVKRGDIEFVKVRETDQHRLGGVPFKITSLTTGESHIIVTDSNGEAKTASSWNAHTCRTNANDAALREDGSVDEELLDAEAGVWFGQAADGSTVTADDALGALPYDTHAVEELAVSANEGLELISLPKVLVSRDGYSIDLGSLDNQPADEASITTAARDAATGSKQLAADVEATVVDRVSYAGLGVGRTYELAARLYDKTDERMVEIDGEEVSAVKTFVAEETTGVVEVEIGPFDASGLAGHEIVVFETLRDPAAGGQIVAEHEDPADAEQTLFVAPPAIGTSVSGSTDDSRSIVADPSSTFVDTVSFANLMPGASYVAEATLMALDDEGDATPLELGGERVSARAEFVPDTPNGRVDVRFDDISTAELAGTRIVVFERLSRTLDDGSAVEVAAHEDPSDAAQTLDVTAPQLATTAQDASDGDHIVVADTSSRVIDTVSYSGLIPGRTYRIAGTIIDRPAFEDAFAQGIAEGQSDGTARDAALEAARICDEEGSPLMTEISFEPQSSQGSVEVVFEFDSAPYVGRDLVVCERLFADDVEIARHADPSADSQTVSVVAPAIQTSAADACDGDSVIAPDSETSVVDTVSYENLTPGKEYSMHGILMDKQSGEPLKVGGGIVESTVTFTPDAPAGSVEVTFTFDASTLAGSTLVAFEDLSLDGMPVASHADLEDSAQTVFVEEMPPAAESSLVQTGDSLLKAVIGLGAAAAAAGVAACVGLIRSRGRRTKLAVRR